MSAYSPPPGSFKPRILYLVQTDQLRGAEIVLRDTIRISPQRESLYLFTSPFAAPFFSEVLPQEQLFRSRTMKRIDLSRPSLLYLQYLLFSLLNFFLIARLVRKHRIDILYGNNSIDTFLVALVPLFTGRKVKRIAHIHSILEPQSMIGRFLKRFAGALDLILVPSNATRDSVEDVTGELCRVATLYNGMEQNPSIPEKELQAMRERMAVSSDTRVISFVGAIEFRKRPDLAVAIVRELSRLRSDFILIMAGPAGDSKLMDSILSLKATHDLPIFLTGVLSNQEIHALYAISDLLLLTSERDPLPTVILEGMSHGVPACSRDVDGASEMIEHGRNGYLFRYDADPAEAAAAIHQLLSLPKAELDKIKMQAKSTIELKFSHEAKQNRLSDLFQTLFQP